MGLKLNGTYQLLAHANEVNVQGDKIDTTRRNMETLILEVSRMNLSKCCCLFARMQVRIMP
jgi:hypothetical protein